MSGKFKNSKIIFPRNFYKIKYFNPTPSHIKKKIFNWIGSLRGFYCLDFFSCTGGLGFEAASRGCKLSILLEKNKKFFYFLNKNKNKLNIKNSKILNLNSFFYINYINKIYYDLIFIDSPYIIFKKLINSLKLSLTISKKNSYIYLESIFNLNLIMKFFKNKIYCLKYDFFKKINFYLFKIF
ncbi:RsmD family RNA methyltransferase [Candidatus Nasuia deltocephalinicola]|uniref:RsmD family RNA methyltransferase n=1 Tax=Candidatus Nasuia deltocephalincola TaxID=1160784 RepID=UPI00216B58F9|nr:RsmD family RNA methyltransferase [Candidatus Nasuia deltocephalinicola]